MKKEEEKEEQVGEDIPMDEEIGRFKLVMNLVRKSMTMVHPTHIKGAIVVIFIMRAGEDTEIDLEVEVVKQMIELIMCLEKEKDQEVLLVEVLGAKKEGGVVL